MPRARGGGLLRRSLRPVPAHAHRLPLLGGHCGRVGERRLSAPSLAAPSRYPARGVGCTAGRRVDRGGRQLLQLPRWHRRAGRRSGHDHGCGPDAGGLGSLRRRLRRRRRRSLRRFPPPQLGARAHLHGRCRQRRARVPVRVAAAPRFASPAVACRSLRGAQPLVLPGRCDMDLGPTDREGRALVRGTPPASVPTAGRGGWQPRSRDELARPWRAPPHGSGLGRLVQPQPAGVVDRTRSGGGRLRAGADPRSTRAAHQTQRPRGRRRRSRDLGSEIVDVDDAARSAAAVAPTLDPARGRRALRWLCALPRLPASFRRSHPGRLLGAVRPVPAASDDDPRRGVLGVRSPSLVVPAGGSVRGRTVGAGRAGGLGRLRGSPVLPADHRSAPLGRGARVLPEHEPRGDASLLPPLDPTADARPPSVAGARRSPADAHRRRGQRGRSSAPGPETQPQSPVRGGRVRRRQPGEVASPRRRAPGSRESRRAAGDRGPTRDPISSCSRSTSSRPAGSARSWRAVRT